MDRLPLRALPISPSEYAFRIAITMGLTAMAEYEEIRYSMPPNSVDMTGML
jgi:hypothetical protein